MQLKKAVGGVLTAKQAPRRPGTAPALGLRAGKVAAAILVQTAVAKEIPMLIQTPIKSVTSRRQRPTQRLSPASRLCLEALEDRRLLTTFSVVNLLDNGAVLDLVDAADAGRRAALDLVLQARPRAR